MLRRDLLDVLVGAGMRNLRGVIMVLVFVLGACTPSDLPSGFTDGIPVGCYYPPGVCDS